MFLFVGTTIYGHDTDFMAELVIGDAVMISHPTTLDDETRIVRMVLSNSSISISSPFSSDLITTTPFRYVKAPKIELTEEEMQVERKQKTQVILFSSSAWFHIFLIDLIWSDLIGGGGPSVWGVCREGGGEGSGDEDQE